MFIVALFTTAKIWKQPRYSPMDKWILKKCEYSGIFHLYKKRNEILLFVTTWMGLGDITLSEISKTRKTKTT